MRALTLTQPWASLVALGAKHFETRSWAAPPGPLLIHAGKNLKPVGGVGGLEDLCASEPYREALFGTGPYRDPSELPRGKVLCVVDLVVCISTDSLEAGQGAMLEHEAAPHEWDFGDYSPGRFAWVLTGLHALPEPLTARGRQKLWNLDMGDPRP